MIITLTTFLPLIGALFLLMLPKEEEGLTFKGGTFPSPLARQSLASLPPPRGTARVECFA